MSPPSHDQRARTQAEFGVSLGAASCAPALPAQTNSKLIRFFVHSCMQCNRLVDGACMCSGVHVPTAGDSASMRLCPDHPRVFYSLLHSSCGARFTFVPCCSGVCPPHPSKKTAHHIASCDLTSHQLAVTRGLMHRRAHTNTATTAPLALSQDSTCPACDQARA
jgi:hypothetical protein